MSCEREMAAVLRGAGQKVTPQRMLILCSVHHAEGHITASQILAEVRRSQPYIDASTVYRTLASAKELRLVSETKMASGDNTFEWLGADRHHHLICRVCGEVGCPLDSIAAAFQTAGGVLGLFQSPAPETDLLDGVMDLVVQLREEARKRKDFATADRIRDALSALGIVLEDTKAGVRWKRK